MSKTRPLDVDERLHAWVDGRLVEDDGAFAARLAADPALAALGEHYRRQNEGLRGLHTDALDEPVPMRLVNAARGAASAPNALGKAPATAGSPAAAPGAGPGRVRDPRRSVAANAPQWRSLAAMAAALALGLGIGLAAGGLGHVPADDAAQHAVAVQTAALTRAAAVAHAAYAPEVRHPVEVAASEQAHLVAWLSKRLGTSLKVPDLSPSGFRLVGGRLLPGDDTGVAAQFMFENPGGQRLTLFVRRDAAGGDTAFRFAEQGALHTFYWIDRGFGYALSGELPRESMLSVATSVYRQLNP